MRRRSIFYLQSDVMDISSFDDLLAAARQQPQPQRLLFVFVGAEPGDDSTPEQRAGFEAGRGGTLTPLMCADKSPDEISDFARLEAESCQFGNDWVLVFVAGLDGRNGNAPTPEETKKALARMEESVKAGSFNAFIPFDRTGHPAMFT